MGKTWTRCRTGSGPAEGASSSRSWCRRGSMRHGLRDVRRAPANDFETWIYAAAITARAGGRSTATSGRGGADAARGPEEPRRAVPRHRDRDLRDARPRRSWMRMKGNMPTVRVDEMVIHPRDNALVVGTHGRAIWILDNLVAVQEMAAAQRVADRAALFSAAADGDVPPAGARPQLRVLGRPDVLRREPAAGGGDLVVQQEGRRRACAPDHRRTGREVREISGPVLATRTRPASRRRAGTCASRPCRLPAGGGGDRAADGRGAARRRPRAAGTRRARSAPGAAAAGAAAAAVRLRRRNAGTVRPPRAPTTSRSSSTARPSTPSRCACRRSGGRADAGRAQAHVRHGDGAARAAGPHDRAQRQR
jgi:hypothetical protein